MIVILKPHAEPDKVQSLLDGFAAKGLSHHISTGQSTTIVGIIGDTSRVDIDSVLANDAVQDVKRVSEPYKAANRKFHPEDTVIGIERPAGETVKIGGGHFAVAAGPCSVETREQIIRVAQAVKASGARLLRAVPSSPGPRRTRSRDCMTAGSSSSSSQKKETGLPIVTELMSLTHLDLFAEVDVIQVGARNMQNFEMLKELGHCGKPILLKRGLANTLEEFLMSAEYIMAGGNSQVILCERGIRTFETMTRNTLDISAIPLLKHQSHLPVIVDPSHAAGIPWLVEPLSKAAIAAGADGLMIEVHNDPKSALCDGAQSLTPEQFDAVMKKVERQVAFEAAR